MELTRKEYNIIAKNRDIIEPQKMSTQELIDTLSRYDSRRKVLLDWEEFGTVKNQQKKI